MRREADRKAAIVGYLLTIQGTCGWPDRLRLVQAKFGIQGTSKPTLKRYLKAVQNVAPINHAPALVADYTCTKPQAPTSDAAWSLFLTILRDAGKDFPIKQAWRDVRDLAPAKGWDWPQSYVTILRRWNALPDMEKHLIRFGRDAAQQALAQPAHRDKTTLQVLEQVSLDGRTLDFWVDLGDGRCVRPTMLALIDVATNMVLGYELVASENAVDTVRLIRSVCEKYGIFDTLYTDNGSAFAGYLVAGGNIERFRNIRTMTEGFQPPGICHHLGIDLKFAMPGNAQAKIAERTFASLSRIVDDCPEFKGAHAGHNPGAAPDSRVTPIDRDTFERVMMREIDRYNRETGHRNQGAAGRSYWAAFHDGLEARTMRRMTRRQGYLASLIYNVVAVNRDGQIVRDEWIYGSHTTQADLLPYHGKGQRIMLGRNPHNLSDPAIAFNSDGNLICENIEYVERGRYDSVDGIRRAAGNKKAVRDATAKATSKFLSTSELNAALLALPTFDAAPVPAPAKVVGARFGSPLRDVKAAPAETVPSEFYANMENALRANRAKGE